MAEKVSCEGMPYGSFRIWRSSASLDSPNSAISEQFRAPHSTELSPILGDGLMDQAAAV
jgi:hypothetical protein